MAQRAGVGRYARMLVEHLGGFCEGDTLSYFYFDFKKQGDALALGQKHARVCRWIPGRIVQYAWKKLNAPPYSLFAGTADVYHFPNFIRPPLSQGKSVVTIHDVSFLRFPETMEPKNYKFMSARIEDTVKKSDAIITDSAFVADEIHELLDVPREKLHPIWLGLDAEWRRPSELIIKQVKSKLQLERPYLLHVGTIEPRKNHRFLVDVFDALENFDGDLVIAGMRGWKNESIFKRFESSPKSDRIRILEYVPDEDLAALYAGAEMLVFPSLYEGFGFPPLESMACGTPVIASAAGSLPEVLGKAAVVLKDFDVKRWASEVETMLSHDARREGYIRLGIERARNFTWEETARRTWDVYRKVGA